MKESEMVLWEKIGYVPKVFQTLKGIRLNLDQCNEIFKLKAMKLARARKREKETILDPDYAAARKEFMDENEIRKIGNSSVWVKKGGSK